MVLNNFRPRYTDSESDDWDINQTPMQIPVPKEQIIRKEEKPIYELPTIEYKSKFLNVIQAKQIKIKAKNGFVSSI